MLFYLFLVIINENTKQYEISDTFQSLFMV